MLKSILPAILLIFLLFPAKSQPHFIEYKKSFYNAFSQGNLESASAYADSAYTIGTKENNNEYLASSLAMKGLSLLNTDVKAAEEYFKKSLKIFDNNESLYNEEYALALSKLADIYYEKDDHKKVLELQKATLAFDLKENENSYYAALSYINTGLAYRSLEQFPEAISHIKKGIEILEGTDEQVSVELLQNKKLLALTYEAAGEQDLMGKEYLKILELIRENYLEDEIIYKDVLVNLYKLYNETGRKSKAEELLQELAYISTTYRGEDNQDFVASVYLLMNHWKENGEANARTTFKRMHEIDANATRLLTMLAKRFLINTDKSLDAYDTVSTERYLWCHIFLYENIHGITPNELAKNYFYNGMILNTIGNQEKAKLRYKKGLRAIGNITDPSREDLELLTDIHDEYAFLYFDEGEYETALEEFKKISKEKEKLWGNSDTRYAISLYNIARAYSELNDPKEAEQYYAHADKIFRSADISTAPDSLYNARLLKSYGTLKRDGFQYLEAEKLLNEALEWYLAIYGENSADHAHLLNEIGLVNSKMGKYEVALDHYKRSAEIMKGSLGTVNEDYTLVLNNIGVALTKMGNLKEVEPYYLESLEILKELKGERSGTYALYLNNLGVYYKDIGAYDKAQNIFLESYSINKEVFGEYSAEVASSLNNLGFIAEEWEHFESAVMYYEQALAIKKDLLGEEDPQYLETLLNLVSLRDRSGNSAETIKNYEKILSTQEKIYGKEHPDYQRTLNFLIAKYINEGEFGKARILLDAIDIDKKEYSIEDITIKLLKAMTYWVLEDGSATVLFKEVNDLFTDHVDKNFAFLNERERISYFNKISFTYKIFYSFAVDQYKNDPSIAVEILKINNMLRGMQLFSLQQLKTKVLASGDPEIELAYQKWSDMKKKISALRASKDFMSDSLFSAQAKAEAMEKEITRAVNGVSISKNLSMHSIQKNMKADEAIISFIKFDHYDKKWTDSVMYYALVIKKNESLPKLVFIGEERQISQALEKINEESDRQYVDRIYGKVDFLNISTKNQLYDLLLKPLNNSLDGVSSVNILAEGALHKINFAAVLMPNGTRLAEHIQVNYKNGLVSDPTIFDMAEKNISIFGGIDYTSGKEIASTDNMRNFSFSYLSGTLAEAEGISNMVSTNDMNVEIFTGKEATEAVFASKQGNAAPQVWHIATHGFFIEAPATKLDAALNIIMKRGNTFEISSDPMLRSGLLLAGADAAWTGDLSTSAGNDGVLTAAEISELDLSKTELVILSACETGLGDIKDAEGVYGLQRAFKMAGADKLIISLWQVPDKETMEFMGRLYNYWMNGNEIKEAFHLTQQDMNKKHSPYYWAAFVLVD